MKKILAFVLAAVMLLSLAACGGKTDTDTSGSGDAATGETADLLPRKDITSSVTGPEDFKIGMLCLHDENATYDNNFIESLVVCLHCDFETRLVTNSDFLLLITNIGNYNSSARLHIQCKVTIQVGNCTIVRIALFYYTCTDDRTFCVTYITGNFLSLLYSIYSLIRRCCQSFSCVTQA